MANKNKNRRSIELAGNVDTDFNYDYRKSNVDTRSDTTRKGYHEGKMSSAQSNNYHPFIDMYNAIENYTNTNKPGSPGYNPNLVTGVAPTPGIKNSKAIVDGIKKTNKYIKLVKESTKMQNYTKVGKRYSESPDIMSDGWPIGDILHLKIPDGTHSSLGIGNYYRAIGNRKGLKSIIENGVVAPKGQFSKEGKVFWNDGYLDRTYSRKGIFALSYDKSGKAPFYPGNKPQKTYVYSSNDTPINFYDEALGVHARIPFTQTYKEIPKTQEGIDYALKLDKINRYVEKPTHIIYNFGLKPYIGYKTYKHYKNRNKKRN